MNKDAPKFGLGLLEASEFLKPKKAENLWFDGKDIVLDGYQFIECRFDNCKLHVSNAENVSLTRCYIGDNTQFVFNGGALAAIRLFNSNNDYFYQNHPYWTPEKDDKGRITLESNNYSALIGALLGKQNG